MPCCSPDQIKERSLQGQIKAGKMGFMERLVMERRLPSGFARLPPL